MADKKKPDPKVIESLLAGLASDNPDADDDRRMKQMQNIPPEYRIGKAIPGAQDDDDDDD